MENACFGRNAWPRELFTHYLDHPDTLFLIAAESTRALGYALAAPAARAWTLDSLAVAPPHQGRGIATRLLRRVIARLARRQVRRLSLMVRLDNSAAIHLYRKLGFTRDRRIAHYYEDGAPAWRMILKLTSP